MSANALLDKRRPPLGPDAATLAAEAYREGGRHRLAGRLAEAIACYDRALALRPAFPEALRAGADILREQGRTEAALAFLAEAIRLRPAYVEAVLDRGNLLCAAFRYGDALATVEAALAARPAHADLLTNKGVVLHALGRLAEARTCLDEAVAAEPTLPQAHLNRGNVLARLGRHADALPAFDQAIALKPAYPAAHANRGLALTWLGCFEAAAEAFEAALALEPDNAYARTNRGKLRLLQGDLAGGLPDYEHRLRTEWQDVPLVTGLPFWSGQDVAGLRMLAFADQGSGDVIHFARYLPHLVAAGADLTIVCRPRLQRLLRPVTAGARVLDTVEGAGPFDVQIPFSSFPHAFATTAETIPGTVPYLSAEAERAASWAARLGGGFRIGLCWRGNQDWRADPHRSVPLALFGKLAALPGVRLISLMGPDQEDDAVAWPLERLDGLDSGPDGFLDTAAVIAALDLVVTCDTSIAHLAGALACPTYLLLQPVPEWRWMLGREDTPWYPTLRLFRQHLGETGGWAPVVDRVVAAISRRLEEPKPPRS